MKLTNLLRIADAADGGAPGAMSLDELAKENAELREQLAAVKKPGALTPDQEKIVREKVRAGLTREQAIAVLQAQQEWDAELARQESEADAKAAAAEAKKGKK